VGSMAQQAISAEASAIMRVRSASNSKEREQQEQSQRSGWRSSLYFRKLSMTFPLQIYGLKRSTCWFQRAEGLVHQVAVRFRTLLLASQEW